MINTGNLLLMQEHLHLLHVDAAKGLTKTGYHINSNVKAVHYPDIQRLSSFSLPQWPRQDGGVSPVAEGNVCSCIWYTGWNVLERVE